MFVVIVLLFFVEGIYVFWIKLLEYCKFILLMLMVLVFVIVVGVGYFIYWIWFVLLMLVVFVIVVILCFIDVVVVFVIICGKLLFKGFMMILEGEFLFNDVVGIILFKIVVIVLVIGIFLLF